MKCYRIYFSFILDSSRVSVFLSHLLSSHMLTPEVIEVSLDSIDEFISLSFWILLLLSSVSSLDGLEKERANPI